jgi:5-methylcytosine-specific restriction enzyme B
MPDEPLRWGLLLKTTLEILRDSGARMSKTQVLDEVRRRIVLTPAELSAGKGGAARFDTALGFKVGDAATIGWASKIGGWSITDAGIEALETYPDADSLWSELNRRYREIDQRRKLAQQALSDVQQFVASALQQVEPGSWTAHDDLARLADTTASSVADFLAGGKIQLPNAYRVLNADGGIPAEGMLNFNYRGVDLQQRLAREGIKFDSNGLADPRQRVTADALKELLDARIEAEDLPPTTKRAWMVRGTNVDGYNLVSEWLSEGFVSLSASQLGGLGPRVGYDELKQAVETRYQHKSYAYRGQRLEEFDRFLRRMGIGDLVLTPTRGKVIIGEVTGAARFTDSSAPHSNLRREVRWLNPDDPIDGSDLRAPVPALLQSQAYVVDLTEAYDQLADLVLDRVTEDLGQIRKDLRTMMTAPARRELAFNPVTPEFAAELLTDQAELAKIADLLWERKQVIFYGPPGTGKTYLATKLARHLTEDGAVKLVQFHPSYTYEDFFEGFRPEAGGSGTLTFTLRAGPFRDFAEVAAANPSTAYILIIDEINRANLAKVFGELYFLLEYRDQSISLQYSPDKEFILPENLFLIGTMNTADRSIARIDTAMRRRFAFVELDPCIPPVQGLLGRWLTKHQLPLDAAQLLDELNRRIADSDAAIGPSYLMDERIYQRADGLDRVWQYSIMPLLEDMFYGQRDLNELYGLTSLRKAITAAPAES